MSISYVKPAKRTPPARPAARTSQARTQLRYWIDQYQRLTREIQAAQVTNNDQWRKEQVALRPLYNQRAAAAAQMAVYGDQVLQEL